MHRHTAAYVRRGDRGPSPLSSFLRCFMTEISSAASRDRLGRRRRSKLRGGRGARGGRGRGRSRPADRRSRDRAPYVRLPPSSFLLLFSSASPQPLLGKYARARFWPFVRSKLGFLCGSLLAPPCRCHPSPRRRRRHLFAFGAPDKPFMRSKAGENGNDSKSN